MSESAQRGLCTGAVWVILIVVSLSLLRCAGREPAPKAPSPRVSDVQTLLVVPFKIASQRYEVGSSVRCAMCGTVFITGPSTPGDDTYMTGQLLTYLKGNTTYTLIPPGAGEGVRSEILARSVNIPERDLLLEMGRKLKADAVVSGTIFRFQQRVGTSFSVETPASVAFSMYLLRVVDGHMMWDGAFDETQRPLSDNLLKLSTWMQRGGAWLTAEQLAHSGLNKVMAGFPVP